MGRGGSTWLAAALLAAGGPAVTAQPAPVQAWIEAAPAGSGQTFTAHVRTREALSGRYELTASRLGLSGRSSTRQAGDVALPNGGDRRLSQLSLSPLGPDDRWEAVLKVFEGDVLVAEHRLGSPVR